MLYYVSAMLTYMHPPSAHRAACAGLVSSESFPRSTGGIRLTVCTAALCTNSFRAMPTTPYTALGSAYDSRNGSWNKVLP